MSFFKKKKGKRNNLSISPSSAPEIPLVTEEKKAITQMANPSEFEIPSSILAASVVAKSDLQGAELQKFAIKLQRMYARQMYDSRKTEDEARPNAS